MVEDERLVRVERPPVQLRVQRQPRSRAGMCPLDVTCSMLSVQIFVGSVGEVTLNLWLMMGVFMCTVGCLRNHMN